ncbi:MAG: hypothetical protein ACYSUI_08565 [Planctomycetota bacterium]|jgi:hypothetical protein
MGLVMHFELLAGLLAVVVVAGLFFVLAKSAVHLLVSLGRGMDRLLGGLRPGNGRRHWMRAAGRTVGRDLAQARYCPQEKCRHSNVPVARFCARCGRPLAAGGPIAGSVAAG